MVGQMKLYKGPPFRQALVEGQNIRDKACQKFTAVFTFNPYRIIVKLHSDLRILTQLQLVGVGVDFVFPLEEEGRRRRRRRITLT